MNEAKRPAIRFRGFSDEWKKHSMSGLTTELHEYATLDSLYPLLTSSREGIMFQNEYRSNRTTDNNETLFSVVPYGKCTYRHMSDDDIFHFNINDIVENGLVSREYPVFDSTDNNDLRFIVALLNSSEQFRRFCRERKMGGTRTRLYYKHLSNFKPRCPMFNEQRSIADFLDNINNLLSHHQSKLKKFQALKASMLERMFPRDGADVPKVRFKGFSGVWKTICLKDITSEITRTDKTSDAPIMMITAANGFIDQSDRYSFDNAGQSLAKYIVLKKGELAYNHGASKLRPYGSCFALEVDEARIPYVYHCFTISDHNPYFISRVLNNNEIEKQLRRLVTSGARMDGLLNISYEEYTTIKIQLPEKDEQDKIIAYFKNIENLIDFSQQELNRLQSIKKALLEKMFV